MQSTGVRPRSYAKLRAEDMCLHVWPQGTEKGKLCRRALRDQPGKHQCLGSQRLLPADHIPIPRGPRRPTSPSENVGGGAGRNHHSFERGARLDPKNVRFPGVCRTAPGTRVHPGAGVSSGCTEYPAAPFYRYASLQPGDGRGIFRSLVQSANTTTSKSRVR